MRVIFDLPGDELVLLTGTIHADGGDWTESTTEAAKGMRRTVRQKRKIDPDRRRANVVITNYVRRVRRLRLLKTPWGQLFTRASANELQTVLGEIDAAVREYNQQHKDGSCKLINCYVPTPLTKDGEHSPFFFAIASWMRSEVKIGNRDVKAALAALGVS